MDGPNRPDNDVSYFADGFFIPNSSEISEISNPKDPFYAIKFAAAVQATRDPPLLTEMPEPLCN